MDLKLRKFAKFVDKTFIEGGKKAKEPVLLVSVAAVIENPWAGKGFVEDLKPEILDLAPQLGDLLVFAHCRGVKTKRARPAAAAPDSVALKTQSSCHLSTNSPCFTIEATIWDFTPSSPSGMAP